MRHITELVNESWFWAKPWMVLATGPSLDRFNPEEHKDKNIAAIYAASDVCDHVDLHFISDAGAIELKIQNTNNSKIIATRTINIEKTTDIPNMIYWEYDCDIKNNQNGYSYFPHHTPFPCSCTSSFIFMFLGMCGVKKIYTYGFDGGEEYSTKINNTYVSMNKADPGCNADLENEGVYGWSRIHGIEIIKL